MSQQLLKRSQAAVKQGQRCATKSQPLSIVAAIQPAGPLCITYCLRCIQFLVHSNVREVFLSDFQCEVMALISTVTAAMIKMADSNSAAFMH